MYSVWKTGQKITHKIWRPAVKVIVVLTVAFQPSLVPLMADTSPSDSTPSATPPPQIPDAAIKNQVAQKLKNLRRRYLYQGLPGVASPPSPQEFEDVENDLLQWRSSIQQSYAQLTPGMAQGILDEKTKQIVPAFNFELENVISYFNNAELYVRYKSLAQRSVPDEQSLAAFSLSISILDSIDQFNLALQGLGIIASNAAEQVSFNVQSTSTTGGQYFSEKLILSLRKALPDEIYQEELLQAGDESFHRWVEYLASKELLKTKISIHRMIARPESAFPEIPQVTLQKFPTLAKFKDATYDLDQRTYQNAALEIMSSQVVPNLQTPKTLKDLLFDELNNEQFAIFDSSTLQNLYAELKKDGAAYNFDEFQTKVKPNESEKKIWLGYLSSLISIHNFPANNDANLLKQYLVYLIAEAKLNFGIAYLQLQLVNGLIPATDNEFTPILKQRAAAIYANLMNQQSPPNSAIAKISKLFSAQSQQDLAANYRHQKITELMGQAAFLKKVSDDRVLLSMPVAYNALVEINKKSLAAFTGEPADALPRMQVLAQNDFAKAREKYDKTLASFLSTIQAQHLSPPRYHRDNGTLDLDRLLQWVLQTEQTKGLPKTFAIRSSNKILNVSANTGIWQVLENVRNFLLEGQILHFDSANDKILTVSEVVSPFSNSMPGDPSLTAMENTSYNRIYKTKLHEYRIAFIEDYLSRSPFLAFNKDRVRGSDSLSGMAQVLWEAFETHFGSSQSPSEIKHSLYKQLGHDANPTFESSSLIIDQSLIALDQMVTHLQEQVAQPFPQNSTASPYSLSGAWQRLTQSVAAGSSANDATSIYKIIAISSKFINASITQEGFFIANQMRYAAAMGKESQLALALDEISGPALNYAFTYMMASQFIKFALQRTIVAKSITVGWNYVRKSFGYKPLESVSTALFANYVLTEPEEEGLAPIFGRHMKYLNQAFLPLMGYMFGRDLYKTYSAAETSDDIQELSTARIDDVAIDAKPGDKGFFNRLDVIDAQDTVASTFIDGLANVGTMAGFMLGTKIFSMVRKNLFVTRMHHEVAQRVFEIGQQGRQISLSESDIDAAYEATQREFAEAKTPSADPPDSLPEGVKFEILARMKFARLRLNEIIREETAVWKLRTDANRYYFQVLRLPAELKSWHPEILKRVRLENEANFEAGRISLKSYEDVKHAQTVLAAQIADLSRLWIPGAQLTHEQLAIRAFYERIWLLEDSHFVATFPSDIFAGRSVSYKWPDEPMIEGEKQMRDAFERLVPVTDWTWSPTDSGSFYQRVKPYQIPSQWYDVPTGKFKPESPK